MRPVRIPLRWAFLHKMRVDCLSGSYKGSIKDTLMISGPIEYSYTIWPQYQNHGLSIKIMVSVSKSWVMNEDYQSVIETVWCEIYNYAHLLSCIFPLQHSISDYICICENGWEGENCQTAAMATAAANVGGNNTGAAVTGGVVVVIFLLLLLIVIVIVIAVLIFYKRKSKCIGGVHTTSTFARSTPMWSTLTVSTFHEINHYKINLSWLQELSWFCKSWFWSYSGWFHEKLI